MAKMLFASNNIAHFPGSVAGSVVGTFSPTRVPYSIGLSNFGLVTSPKFKPTTGDVSWFHFRVYVGSTAFSIPSGHLGTMFQCFDASNNLLFKLARKNSTTILDLVSTLYNGTTSIVSNNLVPLIEAKVNSIDIKMTVNSLQIRVDIFVNTAPAGTITFGTNPNALTAPDRFMVSPAFASSLATIEHFSEFLVSDSDTRNARLNLLRPLSAGVDADWEGSLAALADDDTTSGMTTTEAAARQSMTLSPYVGATNISNFITTSMTTRGQNSPTKLRHSVRLSGVNYDSADIPLGNALEYSLTDYELNPATSLPWVSSDLSAIETGFLSVA